MKKKLTWDESKRQANLQKHGLDFADAGEVLNSRYRLDLMVERNGERVGWAEVRSPTLFGSDLLGFLASVQRTHTIKH